MTFSPECGKKMEVIPEKNPEINEIRTGSPAVLVQGEPRPGGSRPAVPGPATSLRRKL